MKYLTTNIRIEADVLKELKLKAVHEGKRVAELVRDAIGQYLHRVDRKEKFDPRKDPLFSIVGMCETGIKDASENLDVYLYGKKRK